MVGSFGEEGGNSEGGGGRGRRGKSRGRDRDKEGGRLLYAKIPPLHWKLGWNAKISFSMKNLAQKGLTLPEH